MTNKKNSAQESLGATHSALEQLRDLYPAVLLKNDGSVKCNMGPSVMVSAMMELDERLRQLEVNQRLMSGPCDKVQKTGKTCIDCGWNHSTGKREFDVKHIVVPNKTFAVTQKAMNKFMTENGYSLEEIEAANRFAATKFGKHIDLKPIVTNDARTIERTEGALHEVPLPDDTFDALVELLEFEDTSVETNWMTIKSTTFKRLGK